MKVVATLLPEVLLMQPRVLEDERGTFFESFNQARFDEAVGYPVQFVQDNHSLSKRNVLRGLHFQSAPHEQGKLVRVAQGKVFDVVVDVRPHSPRFGRWVGAYLDDQNKHQLWIPPGFAHGFLAISDAAQFLYKTTSYYAPSAEKCLAWNDPDIGIVWPLNGSPTISDKDAGGTSLASLR